MPLLTGLSSKLDVGSLEMNHDQINNYLQKAGVDWIIWQKNPPDASPMAAIGEHHIRTASKKYN